MLLKQRRSENFPPVTPPPCYYYLIFHYYLHFLIPLTGHYCCSDVQKLIFFFALYLFLHHTPIHLLGFASRLPTQSSLSAFTSYYSPCSLHSTHWPPTCQAAPLLLPDIFFFSMLIISICYMTYSFFTLLFFIVCLPQFECKLQADREFCLLCSLIYTLYLA